MIVAHAARPGVTVFVQNRVVRVRPLGEHGPFSRALGFGIEHAQHIAAILREPQPVLRVHVAAARRRVGCRCWKWRDVQRLGVDPNDVLAAEVRAVKIILRV